MPILNLTAPRDKNNTPVSDPLSMYKISDQDAAADPQFFGFLAHDGSWYIQKWNQEENSFRYATSATGYLTAWANRLSLAYYYFDEIF